jgi:cobalt-zinc-cadmium efflux system outer membrane protein
VQTALAQHPLVEAARARVEAARGVRVTAAAFPNPVATYWMENGVFPGQQLPTNIGRETSTYVTLPLEPFIQRAPRVRRADEDIKAAEASLTLARRQVALDAVRAFFRVALAQAVVAAAEENRAALEQLVGYNRNRVHEGVTAEGELLRVQVEFDRASTDLALAEVELARSRAELAPYVDAGQSPAATLATLHVAEPSAAVPARAAMPDRDTVLARARNSRPELVAGRARVAAAVAETDYEWTVRMRQLGATFGNKRVEGQNTMIAGVSVTVPLFDRNRGGVQRANSEKLAAELDLAWNERTVLAEVQGAYGAAERLTRQLITLQQSFLSRADEVYRITVGAYQEGGATLLQVLDATRTRGDSHLTYSRTLFAQRQSLFELVLASGTDPLDALTTLQAWKPPGPADDQIARGVR